MKCSVVSIEDVEIVRKWRNEQLLMLRTPYGLTVEAQEEFYYNKIVNRESNCRFWSVRADNGDLLGMIGLENIQWENRIAEISLITAPEKCSLIPELLKKLLELAFTRVNLIGVFTEVYDCSPNTYIWESCASINNAVSSELPLRKYCNGQYYGSVLYTFIKGEHHGDTVTESASTLN